MAQRAILLAILVGCTKAAQAPPPAQPQSCLDQQLASRGLNEFGDPPGTNYPGGTPLFDERTGKRTDRAGYILSRHPDIARACSDAGP